MLEVFGILIAFVTVILVLSLATTGLSQMTSALLRLRGRNLYRGLTRLVSAAEGNVQRRSENKESGVAQEPEAEPAPESAAEPLDPNAIVESVFDSGELLRVGRGVLSFLPNWLRGPERTWIEAGELKEALAASELPAAVAAEAERLYPQLERLLKKRFAFLMRLVALFWAFVVAFAFQVSAPDLLRELSTDRELRARVLELTASLENRESVQGVPARALEELRDEYAEAESIAARLEAVSAEDLSDEALLAALAAVSEEAAELPAAEREAVVDRYRELVIELEREDLERTLEQLGGIDIRLWGGGEAFYYADERLQWGNLLGVLITALLLSLGAPFWFRMLSQASSLRDMLAPPDKEQEESTEDPEA